MSGGLKGESLQTLIMGEFSTPIALNIKGDKPLRILQNFWVIKPMSRTEKGISLIAFSN